MAAIKDYCGESVIELFSYFYSHSSLADFRLRSYWNAKPYEIRKEIYGLLWH